MQHHRITTLLQKLQVLSTDIPTKGLIDVDLMLDYTRVVYADLISLRQEMTARQILNINEPTLDELTAAMVPEEEETELETGELLIEHRELEANAEEVYTQSKAFAPPAVPVENAHYSDSFQQWIGLNDRYLFLQELFGNDAHKLDQAIKKIDQSENIGALHTWLSEHVPESKSWDPANEATETFYSLTGRYFSEKK